MGYGYGDDDCCVEIKRASNGFIVCLCDPDIMDENDESDGRYKDPHCEYVFKTSDEVVKFLAANLEKALPEDDDDEYGSTFDAAVAADDKD